MSQKPSSRVKKENFKWGGLHPFFFHPFVFHFIPDLRDKTVVDCGCGKGIWGYLIRATRPFGKGKLIGIDIKREYLDFCKKHKVYDKLTEGDIKKLPFKDRSVDFLLSSEVIEHLTMRQGQIFLNEVDRVMVQGGRAIITTPNVGIETVINCGADAHYSLWDINAFRRRGFKVYGLGVRISPGFNKWYTILVHTLNYIFTPITFKFPYLAGSLIAVRDY